jgi:hypothetical protein
MFWQALRYAPLPLGIFLCSPLLAEDGKVETANATYEIRPDPKNGDIKCVFKADTQLLCIERELVSFGKPVTTRDYTLIPVYDDCGGSACGRSRTTLLIEKGKQTRIDRTLKRFCVECGDKLEAKGDANEVAIALDRKDGHAFSALFRNGAITISKKPLDPKEAFSDDDCTYLYEDLLDTCIGSNGQCRNVSSRLPGANSRAVAFMENYYAAFPAGKISAACDAACSSRKKPDRADFDKEICRR